jgi:hypothetical protein
VGALDDQLDGDIAIATLGNQLPDRAKDATALVGVDAGASDGCRGSVRCGP